jgi:O-antigen/teichoic acid export membrane protein
MSSPLSRLGKAGAIVTIATTFGNGLAYLAPLLGARLLAPAEFSALATVLAICAIATVPGVALQTAIAVRVARGEAVAPVRLALVTSVISAAVLLLASPVLTSALYLSWSIIALTALMVVPVIAIGAWLGVLQGERSFGKLATGMVLLALARFGGFIAAIALGYGVVTILAWGVVGAFIGVLPILLLVKPGHGDEGKGTAREVLAAIMAVLAMLVMSYMDVIAARHLLSAEESAEYAVLSVLTKGALWAPQVVTVLALPRLAARRRHALPLAAAAVTLVGIVLVGASVFASDLAVRLAGGPAYLHLAGFAPAFALIGAFYSLAFLLVNTRIAHAVKWPSAPVWIAVAGFLGVALTLPNPSIGSIVTTAIASSAGCLVLCAGAMLFQRPAPVAAPDVDAALSATLAADAVTGIPEPLADPFAEPDSDVDSDTAAADSAGSTGGVKVPLANGSEVPDKLRRSVNTERQP